MYEYNPEWVNLKDWSEREEVEAFLQNFGLSLDQDVDYTLVIRAEVSKSIIATCSKSRQVLKCFAVAEEYRGEGITSLLITALIDKLFSQGVYHSFIFTKPANVSIFEGLNFKLIESNDAVALLEHGLYDINQVLEEMKQTYRLSDAPKAALVMNCNPFTLGHQYLIEEAAKNNQEVLVFIVEEDRSLFPFKVRYELAHRGTEHLQNVQVLPSGEYIISSATFPAYFLKEEGERLRAYVHLDAAIFGRYFGRKFKINKRYVGEEPYCKVTKAYNEALQTLLPFYGIEVREIARKTSGKTVISASKVRNLLTEGSMQSLYPRLKELLPQVTLEFLRTQSGKEIAESLRKRESRFPPKP